MIRIDGALERRKRGHTVVPRQSDHDPLRIAKLEQRVEEDAEGAVEPQDLVVNFSRVWTVGVPDGVGRRERHGEQVRAVRCRPESELLETRECELQCDLVHPGKCRR